MSRKNFILILVLFIISCNIEEKYSTINVEPFIGTQSKLQATDYVKSIHYVALETNANAIISSSPISHLYVTSENIIIFDGMCYIFNRSGEYVRTIGSQGKGPKEYISAYYGHYNPITESILIPTGSNAINRFSIDGVFKEKISLPQGNFLKIASINDSLFVGYESNVKGDSPYTVSIFNNKGKVLKRLLNQHIYKATHTNMFLNEFLFFYDKGKLYFRETWSDTIFSITPKMKVRPEHIFHQGKYKFDITIKSDFQTFIEENTKNFFNVTNTFICDQRLIVTYLHNRRNNLLVVNLNDKTIQNFLGTKSLKGIPNDYDGGMDIYPEGVAESRTCYMRINAYDLKAHVASEAFRSSTPKYPERKRELEALANRLKDDDNPVLMVVTFEE